MKSGYGKFGVAGKTLLAHRLSYIIHIGEIEKGKLVCHSCDTPNCVNPNHFFIGTIQDNVDDKVNKNRIPRGNEHHAKTNPENLARGEKKSIKLTNEKILEIRMRFANGESRASLKKLFNIHHSTVGRVILRKSWAHI